MKIKTEALIGPALDWAVAKCLQPGYEEWRLIRWIEQEFAPTANWSQGGPIIDSGKINIKSNLARMPKHPEYDWLSDCPEKGLCVSFNGPTPLIAAMRCFVASRLGDEVDVPDELV